MKFQRHLKSIAFGLLFGFTYAVILGDRSLVFPIVGYAFLGVLIPNLDLSFRTEVKKQNWFTTAFLVPFLIYLIVPRTVYMQALIIGYYGHVVNDLDKKGNFTFAKRRAEVGAVWIISLVIIMVVFNISLPQVLRLFQ